MTIMQLAGFPAEVVDSVVSVLCRMAFDFGLWSDGVAPLLLVCEEAHRYAPADGKIGFRADPPRAVAHRQRRPQIWRVSRPGNAAAGRDRSDDHFAMFDALCHAAVERPRPGLHPLGGVGRGGEPALVYSHRSGCARPSPSARRSAADAHELWRIARRRSGPTAKPPAIPALERRRQYQPRLDPDGDRALAQLKSQPQERP
jgi:hypothetical protein